MPLRQFARCEGVGQDPRPCNTYMTHSVDRMTPDRSAERLQTPSKDTVGKSRLALRRCEAQGALTGNHTQLQARGTLVQGAMGRGLGGFMGRPRQPWVPVLALGCGKDFAGTSSPGYKSGRSRLRGIPVSRSMSRTRSAGALPRAIQPDTVPCERSPSKRAKALCPPAALQASKRPALLMRSINAHTGNAVNAETGNRVGQPARTMSRKSENPPSKFWQRLTEAWEEQDLPTSQNGVATELHMSQGSTTRWYHDEGLPELEKAITIAIKGGVCVEWLLTGRKPKYPLSRDPRIRELFDVVEELDEEGRAHVLRAAKNELLQQQSQRPHQRRAP